MRASAFLLLAALAALAVEQDTWGKVRELHSGLDVRVYKSGSSSAVSAVLYSATEDALIVMIKKEQVAIPKADIDRLDYRPPQDGPPAKAKMQSSTDSPVPKSDGPTPHVPGRNLSVGTVHELGSKPGFETIYRRPEAAAKGK